jgi:hypothetical protein
MLYFLYVIVMIITVTNNIIKQAQLIDNYRNINNRVNHIINNPRQELNINHFRYLLQDFNNFINNPIKIFDYRVI